MANENFSLSFTVAPQALWNEFVEGNIGEASNIFADTLTLPAIGEASNIFADILTLPAMGEASNINTNALCPPNSLLSLPGQSILNGGPPNIMSCV